MYKTWNNHSLKSRVNNIRKLNAAKKFSDKSENKFQHIKNLKEVDIREHTRHYFFQSVDIFLKGSQKQMSAVAFSIAINGQGFLKWDLFSIGHRLSFTFALENYVSHWLKCLWQLRIAAHRNGERRNRPWFRWTLSGNIIQTSLLHLYAYLHSSINNTKLMPTQKNNFRMYQMALLLSIS